MFDGSLCWLILGIFLLWRSGHKFLISSNYSHWEVNTAHTEHSEQCVANTAHRTANNLLANTAQLEEDTATEELEEDTNTEELESDINSEELEEDTNSEELEGDTNRDELGEDTNRKELEGDTALAQKG